MKWVGKNKPAIVLFGLDSGLEAPVTRPIGFILLGLGKVIGVELPTREVVEAQDQPGILFDFLIATDQPLAGAACQQRNLGMDPQNLENRLGMRK